MLSIQELCKIGASLQFFNGTMWADFTTTSVTLDEAEEANKSGNLEEGEILAHVIAGDKRALIKFNPSTVGIRLKPTVQYLPVMIVNGRASCYMNGFDSVEEIANYMQKKKEEATASGRDDINITVVPVEFYTKEQQDFFNANMVEQQPIQQELPV